MNEWKPERLTRTGGVGPFDAPGWYAVRTRMTSPNTATTSFIGPFDSEAAAQARCVEENELLTQLRGIPPAPEFKT
jgi:hypothetical protein